MFDDCANAVDDELKCERIMVLHVSTDLLSALWSFVHLAGRVRFNVQQAIGQRGKDSCGSPPSIAMSGSRENSA